MSSDSEEFSPYWKTRLHAVIFGSKSGPGRIFDIALIICILLSVVIVLLDSVAMIQAQYGPLLAILEWMFTLLFTVEYALRLSCVKKPLRYAKSFYGVVDLLAILPSYVSIFLPGAHYLLTIRVLRVLRIFRVLKLVQYLGEADLILRSVKASLRKLTVFILAVLTLVVILGAVMYVVEGEPGGFSSIPRGIYWAIVTLTTVGYGDISPQTGLGQSIAAVIMLLGYSLIAVPTGIVTVGVMRTETEAASDRICQSCSQEGHDLDAIFCRICGSRL